MAIAVAFTMPAKAQTTTEKPPKQWSAWVKATQVGINDNTTSEQSFYLDDDRGIAFSAGADYYLNRHLCLSGGIYWEQDGLASQLSKGLGVKKINMVGIEAGAKYLPCPPKWIVQPHIGAMAKTNFLNLDNRKGTDRLRATDAYPGSMFDMQWDVRCPAIAAKASVGVDIRIISSVYLCVDYGIEMGFGSHNNSSITFVNGPMAGRNTLKKSGYPHFLLGVGLKMDFPARAASQQSKHNLLMLIASFIGSKR